jgi:hypothetical protein
VDNPKWSRAMWKKTLTLILCLNALSACVATPRIEIPDTLSFNYQIPNVQPMSYNDVLCCVDCHV